MYKIYEDFAETDGCIVDEVGLLEVATNCLQDLLENSERLPTGNIDGVETAIKIIEAYGLNVKDVGHNYQLG